MSGQSIGYIRVSSVGQSVERQLNGLSLDKMFIDKASGKNRERPELKNCLDYVREGDTLYIHSLDRLGRSLIDLEQIVSELVGKGVCVVFHKEQLTFDKNGHNSMGRLLFQVLGAFAEFERNMIRERQAEGIAKAKAQGKHLGRWPKLSEGDKVAIMDNLSDGVSVTDVAKIMNVSRGTIYNVIKEAQEKNEAQ